MQPINREDWLTRSAECITWWYKDHGFDAKYVVASCGWPINDPKHCAGEVWHPELATDGQWYVHVNPILSDSVTVLGILAHEVAHTIDFEVNHRGVFLRAVRAIGLSGPPWAQTTIGPKFEIRAYDIIKKLGHYPFKGLVPKWKRVRQRVMSVYTCEGCGYTAMIPRKQAQTAQPLCAMPSCIDYRRKLEFKEQARI